MKFFQTLEKRAGSPVFCSSSWLGWCNVFFLRRESYGSGQRMVLRLKFKACLSGCHRCDEPACWKTEQKLALWGFHERAVLYF